MIHRAGLGVASALALVAIALGVLRAGELEAREVFAGRATTLREAASGPEAVLARAHLFEGTRARFELCASDPMEAPRWAGALALEVRLDDEIGLAVPLTEEALATARRGPTSACLDVGSGPVLADGEYAIAATFDGLPAAVADVPLRARISARRELEDLDLGIVASIWGASFLLVLFLAARATDRPGVVASLGVETAPAPRGEGTGESAADGEERAPPRRRLPFPGWARVLVGLALMLAGFFAVGLVASGASGGLAAGVGLALYEAAVALALVGGASLAARADACALVRPARRAWLWFPVAAVTGLSLVVLAQLATRLVPSTSASSVETFVSWPSGMLSFAALAVAAPLAEEIFFRGFLYGALRRYGVPVAFLGAWLLFVAFHGAQTWGQWGALVGIGVTGLGLTTLRALSGSALVSAVAHLAYNGLLALSGFV
ncbi:MAG: CPBP family intramembrane metalloprotease [Sandaracinaceae bacterium]|nr:CPBP family intramembrane metalloprotease [Sandaracinaceae bacterium]